jgi:hypothetical protein
MKYKQRPISVEAFMYQPDMEDGFKAKSINTRGRPFVKTPNGDQFIFEGNDNDKPDWIIIYPDGTKEVISDELLGTRFSKRKEKVSGK